MAFLLFNLIVKYLYYNVCVYIYMEFSCRYGRDFSRNKEIEKRRCLVWRRNRFGKKKGSQ